MIRTKKCRNLWNRWFLQKTRVLADPLKRWRLPVRAVSWKLMEISYFLMKWKPYVTLTLRTGRLGSSGIEAGKEKRENGCRTFRTSDQTYCSRSVGEGTGGWVGSQWMENTVGYDFEKISFCAGKSWGGRTSHRSTCKQNEWSYGKSRAFRSIIAWKSGICHYQWKICECSIVISHGVGVWALWTAHHKEEYGKRLYPSEREISVDPVWLSA